MRRFKASRPEECEKVLCETKRGVLAVIGDGGYPYCVPVDFVYEDGRIYIHGAAQGHKSDAIAACDKVCFTATRDDFRKEGDWAWYATSVVAEKGETSRPKILPLATGDRRRDRARRSSRAIARDRDRTYDGKTGARKMIRKLISIVLETVVVLCAVAGVALSQSFLYFTIQSNLWIAATLAVFAVWQIVKMFKPSAKDIPEAMWRLKFVFTVDVAAQIRVHRIHYADGRCVLRGARADAGSVRQRRKRAHSRRRARVRNRRPLCRQTRRARLRHRCLGASAADLLYRVRGDRLRPQLGLRQRAELPLLLPQLDVARRRVRLRRRRGILHGDVLVDTRADRAGLRHRARLCGDPQTRERRHRRQNRDRNRGRRGRRGERRRGTTAKWKEATAKTMSVSTPNAASTASPIYKTN